MKRQYGFLSFFFVSIIFAALMSGCKDPLGINSPQTINSSDTQKFMKIVDKSSSVNSFIPNYTDDQTMALAGSLAKELYPIRIGQKMKLVRCLDRLHMTQKPALKKKPGEFLTGLNKV